MCANPPTLPISGSQRFVFLGPRLPEIRFTGYGGGTLYRTPPFLPRRLHKRPHINKRLLTHHCISCQVGERPPLVGWAAAGGAKNTEALPTHPKSLAGHIKPHPQTRFPHYMSKSPCVRTHPPYLFPAPSVLFSWDRDYQKFASPDMGGGYAVPYPPPFFHVACTSDLTLTRDY